MGTALRYPNYRRYLVGMVVSMTATWMHAIALAWLVVDRTGSGVALGIVAALQFGPILALGPVGGLMADRLDKRTLLVAAQIGSAAVAGALAIVELGGWTTMPIVYGTALGLGLMTAVDNPTRRAFISEMVPPEAVQNAVSLQTAATTSSRVVGPIIAGVLISVGGPAPSFAANAASFLVFAAILQSMDRGQLTSVRSERAPRQLRDAMRYALHDRPILVPLMMTLMISIFTWEYEVVLPLFAAETFEGSAFTLALLFAALSIGNVAGALHSSTLTTAHSTLRRAAAVLGIGTAATAIAPNLMIALATLTVAGAGGAVFLTTANAIVQRDAPPAMRGRLLALMSMVFLGGRPIGGPIIGSVMEVAGPRTALGCGALGAACAAIWGHRSRDRTDAGRRAPAAHGEPDNPHRLG